MGLFSKKKKEFEFRSVDRVDQEAFFQLLEQQGWVAIETPFEYQKTWSREKIRKSAKTYATKQLDADMLVEVEDPSFSSNPYNDLVYYVYKLDPDKQAAACQMPPGPQKGTHQDWRQTPAQGQYQQGGPPNPSQSPGHDQYGGQQYNPGGGQNPAQGQYQQGGQPHPPQSPGYDPYGGQQYDPGGGQGQYPPGEQQLQPSQTPYQPDEYGRIKVSDTNEMFLKAHYSSHEEAFLHCMDNLAKMLSMEKGPFNFTDQREFLHPIVRIKRAAYYRMGGRPMDLVLMKEAINDYKLLGNECHQAGMVSRMRDTIVVIKTLGTPSFQIMDDYKDLDDAGRNDVAQTLFGFMESLLPKF